MKIGLGLTDTYLTSWYIYINIFASFYLCMIYFTEEESSCFRNRVCVCVCKIK
jgi:hypothetical protein